MSAMFKYRITLFTFSLSCILLTSCGQTAQNNSVKDTPDEYSTSIPDSTDQPLTNKKEAAPASKGTRDNTPVCLAPSADGILTYGNDAVTIDVSHEESGYCMIQYLGSVSKVKLQITGPNNVTYTYNLSKNMETFPFAAGSGNYRLAVYENIKDDQYSTLFEITLPIAIEDEFAPYLYPNQYVNFNSTNQCVALAQELSAPANNDLDVITEIYNYIVSNVTYDYDKASTVQSGYIPDVDSILQKKTGICFDYASLMASMLRSQRIPTRLEIGYVGEAYHAWISTYVKDVGWINGIIQFDGKTWTLMDPTFASSSGDKSLKDFIGDGSNYITKYMY